MTELQATELLEILTVLKAAALACAFALSLLVGERLLYWLVVGLMGRI